MTNLEMKSALLEFSDGTSGYVGFGSSRTSGGSSSSNVIDELRKENKILREKLKNVTDDYTRLLTIKSPIKEKTYI